MRYYLGIPLSLLLLTIVSHGSELGGPMSTSIQDDATFLASLQLAEGFRPSVWAGPKMLQHPVAIDVDDRGRIFVAETHRWRTGGVIDVREELYLYPDDLASQTVDDRAKLIEKWRLKYPENFFTKESEAVRLVEDPKGTGKATKSTLWADGFRDAVDGPAAGVLAYNGTVYFANIPKVWALRDNTGKGVADTRTVIADGFGPRFSVSGHDLHGLVMGPDGRLYFSIGDRGYHATSQEDKTFASPLSGGVFRCEPDGSNLEIFFTGLRNPQEIAFNADGDLFTVDNNADMGDQARVEYLLEGGDGGWSHGWQLLGNDSFAKTVGLSGRQPVAWMEESLWRTPQSTQPAYVLPAVGTITSGPSGVAYCPGGAFNDQLADSFLVADFRGGTDSGVWQFKLVPDGAGFSLPDGNKKKFLWGLPPTDVTFGYDGRIYISDWVTGWGLNKLARIVAVDDVTPAARKTEAKSIARLVAAGFKNCSLTELATLLAHSDMRVRQKAQFELADRGAAGQSALVTVATTGSTCLARLHAIWGLGQIARRNNSAAAPLIRLLTDPESRVRQQTAKVLGDVRYAPAISALIAALNDADVRVRVFAAIALGRCGSDQALLPLLELLRDPLSADPFLRHAAIVGLAGVATPAVLVGLAHDTSPTVRVAAVVALRRISDPGVVAFLDDPAGAVRAEAIRAIYDQGIMTAMPQLVAQLNKPLPADIPLANRRLLALRLVHAAYRYGDDRAAVALAAYAADPSGPIEARVAALNAVAEWTKAPAVDPVRGVFRAPVARTTPIDPAQVKDSIMGIVTKGGDEVLSIAVKLAQTFGYGVPDQALLEILANKSIASSTRAEVINQLAQRRNSQFIAQLPMLLRDRHGEIRQAAFDAQLSIDRAVGLTLARQALLDDGAEEPQIRVTADGIPSDTEWSRLAMPAPGTDNNLARGKPVRWIEFCAKPHPLAGADGQLLPRLTDGIMSQGDNDKNHTSWFEEPDGRFVLDLGQPVEIGRIDTWSSSASDGKAVQEFTLWASDAETMPDATVPDLQTGWEQVARVSTAKINEGGRHGSSIVNLRGNVGRYRWLLWKSTRKGTQYCEIAVYAPGKAPAGLWYQAQDGKQSGWDSLSVGGPATADKVLPYTAFTVTGFGDQGKVDDKLPKLAAPNLPHGTDDVAHQTIFSSEEARFIIDLGSAQKLQRINTYSCGSPSQGAQNYILWAATGEHQPPATEKSDKALVKAGWKRLGDFNTSGSGNSEYQVTTIDALNSGFGPWRWLMWQSPQGPLNHTAFARIDVFPAGTQLSSAKFSPSPANIALRQHILTTLGTLPEGVAAAMISEWLDRLLAGTLPPELALEVTTAAAARPEPQLSEKLKRWQETLPTIDPLAPYRISLFGGNPVKGREVFAFHAAQCIKCHSVNKEGGDAGPDLYKVGTRLAREEILESIVEPGAVVAPGFGIGNIDLKDGSSVFGTFMSQDEHEMVVKPADGPTITVQRSTIASMTPPISSMPPMGAVLSPSELRDLIAYLASLR